MSWFSKLTGIHINVNKGTASINWNELRDGLESGVAAIANVLYPGSAIIAYPFLSKGAQADLRSIPGQVMTAFGNISGGAAGAEGPAGFVKGKVQSAVDNTILNNSFVVDSATGSIMGGAYGAAGAAAAGQDIGKGALSGAAYGGASSATANLAGRVLPGSDRLSQATREGLSTFVGSEAGGKSLKESAQAGGISAFATGLVPKDSSAPAGQQALSDLQRQAISQGLAQYLASGGKQSPVTSSFQPTISGQGAQAQPGTAALAQALRVGDAGGPIFGASGEEKGKKPSGWNIESLRYMGSEA